MEKLDVKDYFERIGVRFFVFFLVPPLIAFLSYQYYSKKWAVIGSIIYISLMRIYFFIRGVDAFMTREDKKQKMAIRKKEIELLNDMEIAYIIVEHGAISPKYLREML